MRDICLDIPAGSTVALVGQSGSGKTTLVDLLPRFYDVTSGSITINGVDIRNIPLSATQWQDSPSSISEAVHLPSSGPTATQWQDSPSSISEAVHLPSSEPTPLGGVGLRSLFGIVSQDPVLFNDTFFANITFGVDTSVPPEGGGTWMDAVVRAATIANAHDFIAAYPDGYFTCIGDRGCLLSGGQRQRISIARAVLRNPPVLILDEATSALDTESEALVQQALERLMTDRTTLVIAHRLSTIRHADLICVIDDGQIVERGTHSDLLALDGHYAKLLKMQSK